MKLGGDTGFLNYYQKHIQSFIASGFRKDVSSHLGSAYGNLSKDILNVHEEVGWTCKSNSNKIQEEIKWYSGIDEVKNLVIKKLILQHDNFIPSLGLNKKEYFNLEQHSDYKINDPKLVGFIFPLKEHLSWDGLRISIIAEYNSYTWYDTVENDSYY